MDVAADRTAFPLAAGWQALAAGDWEAARIAFEAGLRQEETAEALEGLGWTAWWLNDVAVTFDARERAYRRYREVADDRAAGRMAVCLAADHFLRRGEHVCAPLKQAMSRGIKVVSYDSDAAKDCRQAFINQASSEEIGRSEVKLLSDMLGGKGEIAILSATANATNQNTWIKFMKDELTKPEYKDLKLVKVAYGDDDDQKSFQQTQGLLQAYPNLKGIISPTTVGISAAARYISGSKYKGKVVLTGLGTPNQMRKFVKDGTVQKFELWDPKNLGYLAAYTAAALSSGQITGAEGEKFKAGKLGERTIGKDGEIILGPPTVFDKSNIDQYDF